MEPLKLSIVTPSFNQADFLTDTIDSVVGQGYPALEYGIIDGGSTDGSKEIIERHAGSLRYWVSEKDRGQYHAVNKGFARSTGDIMGWINSDDMYLPWAFKVVTEIFSQLPEIEWLTTAFPMSWDERGWPAGCDHGGGYSREAFYRGENLPGKGWFATRFIQQESTFWRRSLWERAGSQVREDIGLAGDFDLWARFFETADLYAVAVPLAGFRGHERQKTRHHIDRYRDEAEGVLRRYGRASSTAWRRHTRRAATRLVPRNLGTLGHKLGLVYPRQIVSFDGEKGRWRARVDYA